jgi:transcriptional regulator with XRE-family HTH domain
LIEPTAAFTLFDKAFSVLGLIREKKLRRTEKIDQALLALYVALTKTRSYISELEEGRRPNREKAMVIAQSWNAASVPLRAIDKDLAERCFEKGGYWMNPELWDSKRIESKRIKIEDMFEATRELLKR